MWFWECPKDGCPFSTVSEFENVVITRAERHMLRSDHADALAALDTKASDSETGEH